MSLLALISIFSALGYDIIPQPIELDVITVEQAWVLNGRKVVSSFTISCPPETRDEITFIGTGHDEVERVAVVPKDLLLEKGQDVKVVGILRVVVHQPAWVNGQFVDKWTEIWIEGTAERK